MADERSPRHRSRSDTDSGIQEQLDILIKESGSFEGRELESIQIGGNAISTIIAEIEAALKNEDNLGLIRRTRLERAKKGAKNDFRKLVIAAENLRKSLSQTD